MRLPPIVIAALLTLASCRDSARPTALSPEPQPPDDCVLSPLGRAVFEAARNAAEPSPVPADRILTYRNAAGRVLIDGEEIFMTLADLFVGAERSIDVAMFDWEVDSDASREVVAALHQLEQRRQGVEPLPVRIVVSTGVTQPASANVEPLARLIAAEGFDPNVLDIAIASRGSRALGVMHQKVVVIDEEIVHVGGANLQGYHDWKNGSMPWHDSAYLLQGEVAWSVLADIDAMWAEAETWTCGPQGCETEPNEPLRRGRWRGAPATECTPMVTIGRRATGFPNNSIDNPQDQGTLAAMEHANEVIRIFTPNLNDDAVKRAILEAVGRDVQVRVILSKGFNAGTESLPGQGGTNLENTLELYEEAIDRWGPRQACERLDIRWYVHPQLGLIEGNGPGASHLKYMSVDGQLAIVGSMNMDTQAWNHSGEVNVAIDDAEATAQYDRQVFDRDFDAGTRVSPCSHVLLRESGFVDAERFRYHDLDLAAGKAVVVRVAGERDVDLYIAANRTPDRSDYDFAAAGHGDDFVELTMPRDGTLQIGVYGWEASDYVVTVESASP